nr:SGNH/GDSL hydrolase family protein [uncultured Pedobacter sp.]
MKNIFYTSIICFLCLSAIGQTIVKPDSKKISYQGRVAVNADVTSFYWPGTSISLNFKGTSIKAKLNSTKENAYFYVLIDDSVSAKIEVLQDAPAKYYTLASNLNNKEHHLELFKLSNSTSANQFFGFELAGKSEILAPNKLPVRKIEFYGNSITAGHGVDTPPPLTDSADPKYFNNYYTYAAISARHFNAQYVNTSRSGIGVTISWFPEIMPETFDRLDPLDANSKWDFKKYQPDVIVVNLFQNDSWLVNNPNHPEFKRRFGTEKPTKEFIIEAYKNLIASIRLNNPKAQIICALGNMDATREGSEWPGYIKTAIDQLNDAKIYQVVFPYKNTPGHPKRNEQQAMANQLIKFIDKNIKW